MRDERHGSERHEGERMAHLVTASGAFHARVLAARLGAAGILTELKGAVDPTYPVPGEVDVYVRCDEVQAAREILLEDAVEAALAEQLGPELTGELGPGQFGTGQFGTGQFGTGQFGTGQFGTGQAEPEDGDSGLGADGFTVFANPVPAPSRRRPGPAGDDRLGWAPPSGRYLGAEEEPAGPSRRARLLRIAMVVTMVAVLFWLSASRVI
ncbi:MAG: hypothetical protein ACYDH5_05875 [Acidimicrobiales bacterium]